MREDADGEQDKKQKHIFLFLLGAKMWYLIIFATYAVIMFILAEYTIDSIQVLKWMIAITYFVISLLLCAVLGELEWLEKVVKHAQSD